MISRTFNISLQNFSEGLNVWDQRTISSCTYNFLSFLILEKNKREIIFLKLPAEKTYFSCLFLECQTLRNNKIRLDFNQAYCFSRTTIYQSEVFGLWRARWIFCAKIFLVNRKTRGNLSKHFFFLPFFNYQKNVHKQLKEKAR